MKIQELELTSSKDRKRVGRGIGSGRGKTAGRGTKGQNSRSGGGVRPGFEGGQNPLAKRLPKKRGFAALNPTEYQVVNLGELSRLKDGQTVDPAVLAAAGLVKKSDALIKVLARGEITIKLTLKVHAASATAKAAIEAAGGTVEIITLPKTPKKATRPQKTEEQVAAS
jgi:large subunit ribosomal protein L15